MNGLFVESRETRRVRHEEVIQINLTTEERAALQKSAAAVQACEHSQSIKDIFR